VTYAVVARNLAEGRGSFWAPSFSSTIYSTFFEQPPLGMALEAIAFRVLGDHLFVERLFSLSVFACTAVLMMALWRRFLPRDYDWLPLFFWVVPSVVTWAAINNMLENTQALFTLLSVFCIVRGVKASSGGGTLAWASGAALAVVAAFLIKGPVGLFPLAVPPLLFLLPPAERPARERIFQVWIALGAIVAIAGAALFAFSESRHAISQFAGTHLVPALQGRRGLPRRSWDIARHLTLGIWARMAAGVALLWLVGRQKRVRAGFEQAWMFFFSVGLIASIPILSSPVLAGHYFVPSVPFFALAAAALSLRSIERPSISVGMRRNVPGAIAAALVLSVAIVLLVHGPLERRDVSLIAGIDAIRPYAPIGSTMGTCADAAGEFGLQSYMQRFLRVSLDPGGGRHDWFVVFKAACVPPVSCTGGRGNSTLQLYECRSSAP
jgi:4-amino-4-deoxy-L-arabinose transferase-like glycosyltransferase